MSESVANSEDDGHGNGQLLGSQSEAEISRRALEQLRARHSDFPRQGIIEWMKERVVTRLDWTAHPLARVVMAASVLVIGSLAAAVVVVMSRAPSPDISIPVAVASTTTVGPPTTLSGSVVAVAGAVRSPGVYRLPEGSRVVDLLEAAGGPADDVDLDRVNLAAPIVDGERVWVARRGESAPPLASDGTGGQASGASSAPLDLNTATVAQLDSLPGVGPATAKAIVDRRNQIGKFRSVEDLLSVKGIGSAKLDALRDSVVVR